MPCTNADSTMLPAMRCAVVMRVDELECDVWFGDTVQSSRFSPVFPAPRTERVSPGHLVAVATASDGADVIIWRWYDAVVLGDVAGDAVAAWEPAHGQVMARPRPWFRQQEPGTRAYLSAGLPGADWWIAGPVTARPENAVVDIDEVASLFTAHDIWTAALAPPA